MASTSDDDSNAPKDPIAKRKSGRAAGARPAAGRKPGARAAKAAAAETTDGEAITGEAATGSLRKKDLLERVGAKSKAKKKDIKDVVEATLLVLGEALAAGEELNLPPLGKAKVNRQNGVTGGDMYIIRLRRSSGKVAGEDATTEALADTED